MRQGSRRFVLCFAVRSACAGALLGLADVACAQGPAVDPRASAWATGGVSATAPPGATQGASAPAMPRYWEVPPFPSAVIQGGAIPAGWQPQPVPYTGVGPDGRPMTTYVAPTYVFTYQSGPPVLGVPQGQGVNRRQARGSPPLAAPGGWNYSTSGAPPALPTVARYAPPPYQFPPGAPQLSGTPIVPPSPAAFAAAGDAGGAAPPPGPSSQSVGPPPSQWIQSSEPPPARAAPPAQAAENPPPPPAPVAPAGPPAPMSSAAPPVVPVPVPVGPAAQGPAAVPIALTPMPPAPLAAGSAAPAGVAAPGVNTHLWRVVGVHDGDTVTCLDETNQQQKIRLAEIDAPEVSQDFGKVSREALAGLVFGKTIRVVDDGRDRYGRWIGHLFVDGIDVNRQMVATGNAWHYAAYSTDTSLAALQTQAQAQHLGLWAQPNPTPPWEYRKTGRKT